MYWDPLLRSCLWCSTLDGQPTRHAGVRPMWTQRPEETRENECLFQSRHRGTLSQTTVSHPRHPHPHPQWIPLWYTVPISNHTPPYIPLPRFNGGDVRCGALRFSEMPLIWFHPVLNSTGTTEGDREAGSVAEARGGGGRPRSGAGGVRHPSGASAWPLAAAQPQEAHPAGTAEGGPGPWGHAEVPWKPLKTKQKYVLKSVWFLVYDVKVWALNIEYVRGIKAWPKNLVKSNIGHIEGGN